eukprot:gene22131-26671_t
MAGNAEKDHVCDRPINVEEEFGEAAGLQTGETLRITHVQTVKLQSLALSTHEDAASFDPANDFLARGFFVLEDLVPAEKVEAALRLLNSSLGSADLAADLETTGIGTEFMDGPGAAVVKLGSGHRCTCSLSQVALRFPLSVGEEAANSSIGPFLKRLTWHSDAEKYNEKKKFDFVTSLAWPLALRRDGSA